MKLLELRRGRAEAADELWAAVPGRRPRSYWRAR